MTDEEILKEGTQVLIDRLGITKATRYISLTLQNGYSNPGFDYTEWQRDNMLAGMSIEEISRRAMKLRETSKESELVAR